MYVSSIISIRLHRNKAIGFWERTCMNLYDDDFRRYYRMNRETLLTLTKYLSPGRRNYPGGRDEIDPYKMVAMTCSFLGSQWPCKQLAGIFGVTESCFINVTDYIMRLIMGKIKDIIKWPKKEDYPAVAAAFDRRKVR